MDLNGINLHDKLGRIPELWSPRIISNFNDLQVKLARLQGEFVWHHHAETDELFLIVKGSLTIQFRGGQVNLEEGELFVVPKGVEHKPVAADECHVLLIEPAGTINTGRAGNDLTADDNVWI